MFVRKSLKLANNELAGIRNDLHHYQSFTIRCSLNTATVNTASRRDSASIGSSRTKNEREARVRMKRSQHSQRKEVKSYDVFQRYLFLTVLDTRGTWTRQTREQSEVERVRMDRTAIPISAIKLGASREAEATQSSLARVSTGLT